VRRVVNGTNPIQVTDVVTLGQTGLSAFDSDSIKVAPHGDLTSRAAIRALSCSFTRRAPRARP